MESPCTCGFDLGVEKLSEQDIYDSQEFLKKYNIIDETILFLGPLNSTERCTMKEKIDKIKDTIRDFYHFQDYKNIIVIPNQVQIQQKPRHFESEESVGLKLILDKKLEDDLHLALVKLVNHFGWSEAFIFSGFQSDLCLKKILEDAKKLRGGNQYADLNIHEKEIMEILQIDEISDEELDLCISFHLGKNETKSESWLYKKVLKLFIVFYSFDGI